MSLSMVPLLIQSSDVPAAARRALRDARDAPPEGRALYLETAARSLYNDLGLDCDDARALVGLAEAGTCDPV
jgi:hypothetical protein